MRKESRCREAQRRAGDPTMTSSLKRAYPSSELKSQMATRSRLDTRVRARVVFPLPFGPITPTIRFTFGWTLDRIPESTVVEPFGDHEQDGHHREHNAPPR